MNEAFAEKQKQVAKNLDSQKKQEFEQLIAAGKKEQAAMLLAQNEKQEQVKREQAARQEQEKKEQAVKQEQEKKEAFSKKAALYPGYSVFEVSVIRVLKEGILADQLKKVSRVISGAGFNMIDYSWEKSGTLIFIKGEFNAAFDDQRLWVEGYPIESPYTIGSRTFQQWQQIPPQPSQ